MRVLRAITLGAALLPLLSFAGWRSVGAVTPPVSDVQMVDAGVVLAVSAASGAIAWQANDAGVTTLNTLAGTFVGAGYYGANCLLGLDSTGAITPTPGCGTVTNLGAGTWRGFKMLSSPPGAVAVVTSGSLDAFWSGPGANPGWVRQTNNVVATVSRSLQSREIGGIDYTAMNTGNGLRVAVDGGAANAVANTSGWRDAAPFALNGEPAILAVTGTTLVLLPDYRVPAPMTPSIPAGVSPRFVGIGRFTGMVTTGGGVLLGPIPHPARPAETWVVRGGPSGESFTDKVHCSDDRQCVTSNAAGDVWLWTNEVPPTVSVVAPQLDAGQTIRLFADAGDGDGDPIYVSWDGGVGGIWTNVAGVDDGTQIDFTLPSGVCLPITIDVSVTDGLPGHERTIQVPIFDDRGELSASGASMRPIAGGGPVSFSAGIDGGCATPTLSWTTSDGRTGSGPNFAWTPPATECNSDGGLVTVTTTATWTVGLPATTSVSQQLVVKPWGAPDQPVFAAATQVSGTTRDYLPTDVGHVCSTASDFPGTQLIWESDAGIVVGGALRIAPPSNCFPRQVTATARREVIGEDEGRVSPPGTLVVDVTPDFPPVGDFAISVQGDAGVLFGIIKLDAGCADQRALNVDVTVFSSGVFVIDGGFHPRDGGWELQIPGGCAGGTFDVVAELEEDGGFTGLSDQGSITLPFSPVVIGAQSITNLEVVCGAGARSTVSLLPEPNACGSAELSWRATRGPALVTMSGSGDTFELQTQATDFSVVGQQLTIEWAADAGAGNGDAASRSIELSVQPFLEFSVKARPPLRREEEAVALDVTLHNTTACAVEGLSVTLPLSGGSPIPESVLLDDVRAAARQTDEGLVIDGVSVPASGFTVIQLSARARLLSSPRVQPVASLRGSARQPPQRQQREQHAQPLDEQPHLHRGEDPREGRDQEQHRIEVIVEQVNLPPAQPRVRRIHREPRQRLAVDPQVVVRITEPARAQPGGPRHEQHLDEGPEAPPAGELSM